MAKLVNNMYLLTAKEYHDLINPDQCYALLTKTAANNIVRKLLKKHNAVCWHDSVDEISCDECPLVTIFDSEVHRICLREKSYGSTKAY
jgi:hypothetical protein